MNADFNSSCKSGHTCRHGQAMKTAEWTSETQNLSSAAIVNAMESTMLCRSLF